MPTIDFNTLELINYLTESNVAAEWKHHKVDTLMITKISWTEQYGLTAYELRNGELYEIAKTQP